MWRFCCQPHHFGESLVKIYHIIAETWFSLGVRLITDSEHRAYTGAGSVIKRFAIHASVNRLFTDPAYCRQCEKFFTDPALVRSVYFLTRCIAAIVKRLFTNLAYRRGAKQLFADLAYRPRAKSLLTNPQCWNWREHGSGDPPLFLQGNAVPPV